MMEYSRSAALESGSGGWHSCQSQRVRYRQQAVCNFSWSLICVFLLCRQARRLQMNTETINEKIKNQGQLAFVSAANHWNHSGLMIWNLNMESMKWSCLTPKGRRWNFWSCKSPITIQAPPNAPFWTPSSWTSGHSACFLLYLLLVCKLSRRTSRNPPNTLTRT